MEEQFIQKLRNSQKPHPGVVLGIGDDAAVLDTGNRNLVVTTDLLTEGVDFLLGQVPNEWIGRKAIAVNLSDLAAMAAKPLGVVVAVAIPRKNAAELAEEFYAGMMPLLEKYDVPLVGGDTNTWDGELVISVTAMGTVTEHGSFTRQGAKPGDRILVTGEFGGSIRHHQFHFEPRINEALYLNKHQTIHAAIDVSDGLSLDLDRLAKASCCGAIIDRHKIPIRPDAAKPDVTKPDTTKQADRLSPLEHALFDGEDFELILAVPPDEAEHLLKQQPLTTPLTDIGEFVPLSGQWLRSENGTTEKITPKGYLH